MFNVLVSANANAWESASGMKAAADRFLEYSGEEAKTILPGNPVSLKRLEALTSLLMYELGVDSPSANLVRVGHMVNLVLTSGNLQFDFVQSGTLGRDTVLRHSRELQFATWEATRTHWAVKDGDIPPALAEQVEPLKPRYDVVLSFAGENRAYVHELTLHLKKHNITYFYDEDELYDLWGKDLVEHFQHIYQHMGRYCLMFVSKDYVRKIWTTHERRAALSRAIYQRSEYILPVRFDSCAVPGLSDTIAYVSALDHTPSELCALISRKLGGTV